ncbi:MAG: aspartate dehydrogenase [Eubacterium sp.]|nr:aspartate dehydrogenase [Eubacterium sp.]
MRLIKKRANTVPVIDYDPEHMEAILKCNTCNSDRVAGFRDSRTGEFTEVMNIRSDMDLADFKAAYGLESVREVYGWS